MMEPWISFKPNCWIISRRLLENLCLDSGVFLENIRFIVMAIYAQADLLAINVHLLITAAE